MAKKKDTLEDATIIDLDADQVIEQVEATPTEEVIAPPPVIKPKSRRGLIVPAVALVAGAVGGGWFYKDYLSSYFPSDQTKVLSDKIAVIESNNATVREQLSTLDSRSAQFKSDLDAATGQVAAASKALTDLQTAQTQDAEKLTTLEQGLAEAKQMTADLAARPLASATAGQADGSALQALQSRIDALEKDIAALKAKPAEAPDNTAILSQSLSDLKAKVASGATYVDELARIQRMVPAAEGLDVLQQHANGLPDAKGLAAELLTLAATLPKPAAPATTTDDSWWGTITDSLSDVITIRNTGETDWPAAATSSAALAETGDLVQAMEQLNTAEGDKPAGIPQWLERAQARLNVDKAVQSVEEAVLRVIAAKAP